MCGVARQCKGIQASWDGKLHVHVDVSACLRKQTYLDFPPEHVLNPYPHTTYITCRHCSSAFDVRNVENPHARLATSNSDSSHHNIAVRGVTASGEDKPREWIFTKKA